MAHPEAETIGSTPAPTILLVDCSPGVSQRCQAVLPEGVLLRRTTLATSADEAALLLPLVIVITTELAAAAQPLAELAGSVGASLLSFDDESEADLAQRLLTAIDEASRRRAPPEAPRPSVPIGRVTLTRRRVLRED